jgi:hypothetical protein
VKGEVRVVGRGPDQGGSLRKQDMTQAQAEKILDLPERYTKSDLRKRFMKLAQRYHPDNAATNGISPEVAQRKMTQVNKAYGPAEDPLRGRCRRDGPARPRGRRPRPLRRGRAL